MSPSVSSQPALDQNKKAPARRVPSGGEIIQSSCALTSAADNAAALCQLAEKLDRHAATVAAIRPAVAALEVSRSKLATWASIGFAAVVVLGWIVEGVIKWTVGWALSHFQ
jgi:hypothetical protein